jgi:serine/threonine-protein kinase
MHVSALLDDTVEGAGRRLAGVDLQAGEVIGGYAIDYLCATGGFADVYRATGPDGSPVALKILHRHLVARGRLVARFLHEAQALARLEHPHIVRVHDLGRLGDGRPYFVMEWLGERTLRDFVRQRGPLSSSEAVSIVADVAAGLGAAHRAGIVHRDLKSKNVMVPEAGEWVQAKLIDFGIAKLTEPERFGLAGIVSTTTVVGTPTCMAPEQILGHRADARTDIYALGILIYELLTGDPPFCGDSRVELEEMHLSAPPPRVSAVAPVPAALDDVVIRCLEKDPARRYQSADEALAAMRAALAGAAPATADDVPGLALYVEARLDGVDDAPDEAFDDIDAVVELARRCCVDAGLSIETDVAVAALGVAEDVPGGRARLLAAARALDERLRARPGASPRVRVSITLHAAPVALRRRGARRETAGGPLVRTGEWARRGGALVVTEEFAHGLAR